MSILQDRLDVLEAMPGWEKDWLVGELAEYWAEEMAQRTEDLKRLASVMDSESHDFCGHETRRM